MTSISELDLFHLLRSLKCMTSFYEQGYKQNQMQQNQQKPKLIQEQRFLIPTIDGNEIELVDQTRLLGVLMQSELAWSAHITDVVLRCHKKLWILRRLKKLGAEKKFMSLISKVQFSIQHSSLFTHSCAEAKDRKNTHLNHPYCQL